MYVTHHTFNWLQSLSHIQLFETPPTVAHQAPLSSTISWSLLKLMSIESVMPSNHLILCLLLLLLPSIFPSIRVFSNESILCIRWPKYWSFSFTISLFNEYSRLICFSMDQFDLVAVQGTLKSLLQYRSSKVSVPGVSVSLWSSSHIHTDYWENHSFDYMDLVGKIVSLLFNTLSRYCHGFSSKEQVSFNFMAAVAICSDFGAKKIKSVTVSIVSYLFAMKWWDWMP